MLVASALFLSTSGLALRNIENAEGWQILFYRSLTFSITVFVYLLLKRDVRIRDELANIGWNGLMVAAFMGTGFIAYVFALLHTTVANALFVISAAPLMIALLAWFVLKERVPIRTCERALFRKYYCFMGACFVRGNRCTHTPIDTPTHVTRTLPGWNFCHRNIWVWRTRFLS